MGKSDPDYSEALVLRVNELYHDLYFHYYKTKHLDKMDREKPRWNRAGERYFSSNDSLTILDIGSGTGFVADATAEHLKTDDSFICSDISARMLQEAEKKITTFGFDCGFKFVKLEPEEAARLPFEDRSIDIVTMNSVLHHVKDTQAFLADIDRILTPNGKLLIGHEPNHYYLNSMYSRFIHGIANPLAYLDKLAVKYSAVNSIKKKARNFVGSRKEVASDHEMLTAAINEILLKEDLIQRQLMPEEIKLITDIRAQEGFQPDTLLADYDLLYLETYDFLGPVVGEYGLPGRLYEKLMSKITPRKGATFFVVLKKTV